MRKKIQYTWSLLTLLSAFAVSACNEQDVPASGSSGGATDVGSETPDGTTGGNPSPTPRPSATPRPGATPSPTPRPTATPQPTAAPTPPPTTGCQLGPNASLGGRRPFPDDNPWNQDISQEPVDSNSANYIASMGLDKTLHPDFGTTYNGAPNGTQYVVVPGNQPRVPITFQYKSESDAGPYPIPPNAPIQGGPNATGDRHVIVVDCDNWTLWETFSTYPNGSGWTAASGAKFNLATNDLRPDGWTSADAAGLPIFPGLVRYDEVVERGEIRHALRFTAVRTQNAYVYPARHAASNLTDSNLPPMGMRVRLKASFDISGFTPNVQVILRALKKYGMFMADNGADWFISGAPNPKWNDQELRQLKTIAGRNFEVVRMGTIVR